MVPIFTHLPQPLFCMFCFAVSRTVDNDARAVVAFLPVLLSGCLPGPPITIHPLPHYPHYPHYPHITHIPPTHPHPPPPTPRSSSFASSLPPATSTSSPWLPGCACIPQKTWTTATSATSYSSPSSPCSASQRRSSSPTTTSCSRGSTRAGIVWSTRRRARGIGGGSCGTVSMP